MYGGDTESCDRDEQLVQKGGHPTSEALLVPKRVSEDTVTVIVAGPCVFHESFIKNLLSFLFRYPVSVSSYIDYTTLPLK